MIKPLAQTLTILLSALLFAACNTDGEMLNQASDSHPLASDFERTKSRFAAYEGDHGNFFEAKNATIHYLSWGESGRTLIWLHGTYSSAYEFAFTAEKLLQEGYRVIAVDYYGHGQTPIPQHEVKLADMAEDLKLLLEDLGIESAYFGGWSRGGSIAAEYYAQFPQQVLGLVLLDGGSWSLQGFATRLGAKKVREWMSTWFDPETKRLAVSSFESEQELLMATRQKLRANKVQGRRAQLEEFANIARAEQTPDGRWTDFRKSLRDWLKQDNRAEGIAAMIDAKTAPPFVASTSLQDPLKIFGNLSVPMLIIDPTGDFMDMSAQNRELAALHPDLIRYFAYEETGHNVLRQRPERFLADLLAFLRTTP